MTCERCDEAKNDGMRYCPYCGEGLEDVKERSVLERIVVWTAPLVLLILICELSYLIGGTLTVWDWATDESMQILGLVPNLVVLCTIHGSALQIAWILIEVAIILSLAYLFWTSFGNLRQKNAERSSIPLVRLSTVFAATIAANLLINGIAIMLGGGVETPSGIDTGNTPGALLAFADAAVWEEVISRIVPIGVPMTVAAIILTRKKESLRYLAGGFGFSRLSIILLIISSIMFGFAHLSGWGPDKVLITAVSGLFIGYLYIRVGIHAAIAVHFLTDYLAVVAYTDAVILIGIATLILICMGFISLLWYAGKLRNVPKRVEDAPWWLPPDQENSLFRRKDD